MKKTLLLLWGSCALLGLEPLWAQENLRPLVALKFGEPIAVDGEFVAKGNDYYSQNLVPEPFALKVISVAGSKLQVPVVIEYKIEDLADGKKRPQWEKPGTVYKFEAYESVYEFGRPAGFTGELEQGRGFSLTNFLHVRLPKKKASRTPEPTPAAVSIFAVQRPHLP